MAHGNGESDGERSGAAHVSVLVTRGEHGQHEHERDEQLDAEHLTQWDSWARLWRAHHVHVAPVVAWQALKECSTDDCTHRLYHDVQERPEKVKYTKGQYARCSSTFPRSWAGSGLAPGVMDGRPHRFHNLLLPPGFHTGSELYCSVTEARGVNNLPKVVYCFTAAAAGIRTHDHWVSSQMPDG